MKRLIISGLFAVLLAGCAAQGPIAPDGARDEPLPAELAKAGAIPDGLEVLWGGRIVAVVNESGSTRIEVLAYPLASDQRPDIYGAPAQGRFVAIHKGFLDPVDYAAGRLITVRGTVTRLVSGQVGDADYTWPEVRVSELHRWPQPTEPERNPPRFNIGVGILFSN